MKYSLSMAKEEYDFVHRVKNIIEIEKFINAVIKNSGICTWIEDTKSGIDVLKHIEEFDEPHRTKILYGHNKRQVCLKHDKNTNKYQALLSYTRFGVIDITIEEILTEDMYKDLSKISEEMDALLLNFGKKFTV